jgi:hypothetical protein
LVIARAGNRCEYCCLAQEGQEATFHIDHIVPFSVGGATEEENLALACVSCSLRKAARQQAVDPESGQSVPLYNPRQDSWHDHFRWNGALLIGLSPTGRATLVALSMNRELIVGIRQVESLIGRHPPS